jgi:hypothetical protein
MTERRTMFLPSAFVVLAGWLSTSGTVADARVGAPDVQRSVSTSAADEILDLALEATAREHQRHGPRPTVGSRMLAIIVTCMFDAWAAYDAHAVGTQTGGTLRRPAAERTAANKKQAMAYAAYRAMLDLFAEDEPWLREQMRKLGYAPDDATRDPATPQGIGNTVAVAVLAYRHHDGANQLGDEIGSDHTPYSDYTFYRPVNSPDRVLDPDRWQPLPFDDGKGEKVYPGFLTPHWYRVKPFGLGRSDRFRPPPPPKVGSPQLEKEVDEVMQYNASLTLQQKAIVELMRDGPSSTGQAGHWLRFAQMVARRDGRGLDSDIKLFFAIANTAMDAFIAAWDAKRYYDSARPWTLVRYYHANKQIRGWAGPGRGVMTLPAEAWHPYSPATFVSPPFPGYVSGHSTVSGACARVMELFLQGGQFGRVERRIAGEITEPGAPPALMQSQDGRPAVGVPATAAVMVPLPTFHTTAEMAGLSRVMGGYHIQADNVQGLALGHKVGFFLWSHFGAYFFGRKVPD